jgi:peptide-methionine (S)-S-oxide reductase
LYRDENRAAGPLRTAVGYSGGYTPNSTYQEVCSGKGGHAEQGNDHGTQHRSAIYAMDDAQDDHQQYLAKHPNGYCGHGGTWVSCLAGLDPQAEA